MDKYKIRINDLGRILQGEIPWQFFIELVIRGLAVYLILIVSFRLMGKRMATKMTRNEVAAVSTLAAAVGIPLQTPDRGLLPGLIIAIVVILAQRFVAGYSTRNEKFEQATQGLISTLVVNGQLHLENMGKVRVTRERIFSNLRSSGIRHLGEVERLYLEANGSFSMVKRPEPNPGLTVLPEWDTAFIDEQPMDTNKKVCNHCGHEAQQQQDCSNCGHKDWVAAMQ